MKNRQQQLVSHCELIGQLPMLLGKHSTLICQLLNIWSEIRLAYLNGYILQVILDVRILQVLRPSDMSNRTTPADNVTFNENMATCSHRDIHVAILANASRS